MSYQNIISFASKQPSFKCYFNNGRSLLTSNQIVSFCIVEDKIEKIIQLVKDSLYNDQSITCYVDDIEVNLNNLELIKKNKDEDIGFTIEHSLAMQKYPITFINDADFKEFISSTIVPIKIKELIKLTNKVVISFLDSESFKKKESMLFVESDKVPGPYVKWPSAIFEKYFSEKNSLSVPYLLPEYLFSYFSRKIFLSFLDTISEKKIDKDEFLIQIGDINSIIVPSEFFLKSNEVKRVYSITEYIFQDSHNFLERLWILRQKLTDCLLEGYDAHNVPWERVLQTVKNNYYFFVHDTINKYIEQTTKLENSTVVIAQDLTKNISPE
ncbi:hypothetical protein TEHD86_2303 [Tetragenococcus halophilus subsp. halophilus]|uniref:hypothetical protein n=1 Tax=Tetragenococcus halophilus TaxID=51669 RepID=UPI000CBA237D|nr:hypothetical protein [Tetragenococcus halophilus]GBD83581.1 hypothetical protein TEHD86_2303 [Tetragenococcus halophilus subsp. halophilus]